MPVYRATIAGRPGTLLVRAETAAKAKDQLVSLEALSGEQMADALAEGEKIWTPGQPVPPAIEAAPATGDQAGQTASGATGDATADPSPPAQAPGEPPKSKPAKGSE